MPTARFLLLVNYRPEYQHGWGSKTYYTQLRLDPLPEARAEELLQDLLGDDPSFVPLKQLLIGQEQQGTVKAAAAAWLGTIYGLRAASRMDANKDWGKVGDDMIGCLEQAYIDHMGKDAAQAIEMGRRLLRTDERIQVPKPVAVPKVPKMAKPVMPKLPHVKAMPRIKTSAMRPHKVAGAKSARPAMAKAKAKSKMARPKAKAKGRR